MYNSSNRISVLLNGGFGNCLFQYNYAMHLSKKGYKVDLIYFKNFIDKLIRIASHAEPHFDIKPLKELGLSSYLGMKELNLVQSIIILFLFKLKFFRFLAFDYKSLPLNIVQKKPSRFIKGTFMNDFTVEPHLGKIINSYINQRKDVITNKYKDFNKSIIIHFRGGDFLSYDKLDANYYLQAIGILERKDIPINMLYVVTPHKKEFINRIAYKLNSYNWQFTEEKDLFNDFVLIGSGLALISSNSTFSWWAAECSDVKIILEPDKYYHDSLFKPLSKKERIFIKTNLF